MAAEAIMNATSSLHPYHPIDAAMSDYVANQLGSTSLQATFALGASAVLAPTYQLIRKTNPTLSTGNTAAALWFVLCGFIHFFFEGYFVYNQHRMPSRTDIFGQLWKEYSLSDSRYLTQDSFVVCMEAVTALFWGPLSFACAYCIVQNKPLRHPLQIIISLGQLYGDVLYYATCTFDKVVWKMVYCRPEAWYFWFYYVMMNAFWIVIPTILMVGSVVETKRAFAKVAEAANAQTKGKKEL
ncbi:3-beta-hydroxysteroid-Delta(8),Delta(7)-isomerase [Colletotrichum spinosum]|uniref:3-beta-hydroxysteroid-Delta(8), Delta(7)-isomerase n=1 Tax=Colletotrichum spinosum TaxID=1347390 RepID=A0A4V3HT81_9PEZI|nr:3-beta-hydroxysteroid-Delta(8),Delta(7)-isomerase [Colletotrichum spinosum]